MTRFTVVTILPELIDGALGAGVVARARAAGALDIATINPRDFTTDKHRSVDDTPYGGGPGMVMKCEPLAAAIDAAAARVPDAPAHRILLSPAGAPLTQARVRALATLPHLVLVCGRYEGVDERVVEACIDEEVSLGDFVLTGGELGAAVVIDAVARLLPGVLGEPTSADDESFSAALLEYPQYTRPQQFRDRAVPEVLQGGNHEAIRKWRRREALRRTAVRRPDLLARHRLTAEDVKLARDLPELQVAARTHVALVHHPVFDKQGDVVTSAVTNFDVHDIARSCATYGLGGYHVVTPVASQRDKVEHIAAVWTAARDAGRDHRLEALARVHVAASIDEAIAQVRLAHGIDPVVVATTASPERFAAAPRRSPAELVAEQVGSEAPVLLLFGTGWGLVDDQIPVVSRVLDPISGRPAWNHLAVRSAVAIILDRMFGLRDIERAQGPDEA
ncbi:MAG: tRNA (guanosine(37)-N1)-methyltransferase TrmD [Kofleriaceae bacterium]|nr:tRNA (guanosine(37)-N1)-methyltransferase TrmD [Myxococcales bacterium]MCB9572617.1 tRNA (guanosine(37)-N1)-methyltransferase TrmD [Kofleriaceae bacterium]